MQVIYRTFLGSHAKLTPNNLLECSLTSGLTMLNIVDTLKYLCDAYQLVWMAQELQIPKITSKSNKTVTSTAIASIAQKILNISVCEKKTHAVILLQRRWRSILNGTVYGLPTNENDPFTLTCMTDIPTQEYFAYKDHIGRVWGFNAFDLYYHFVSNSATNPLNRDAIDDMHIRRLGIIVSRNPHLMRDYGIHSCDTIEKLYAYILHMYEQEGFYLLISWFTALSCENILDLLSEADIPLDIYFRNPTDYECHRALVTHMYDLYTDSNQHRFRSLCTLICDVADFVPEMKEALPEWVALAAW